MPTIELVLLAAAFLAIAAVYASVGFGGGSSYTAALATMGLSTALIPVLSLSCNLIVAAGGVFYFSQRGHTLPRLVWPFLITSIPASYLGGRMPIDAAVFLALLGASLLVAAGALLLSPQARARRRDPQLGPALLVGALLGLLSGMVGIGGGIFLAPTLLLLGWGEPKQVAASAAVFIFVNSAAGLAGQFTKGVPENAFTFLVPLALAVLVGGQLGSRLGSSTLPAWIVRRATALLVAVVGVRILLQSLPQVFGAS